MQTVYCLTRRNNLLLSLYVCFVANVSADSLLRDVVVLLVLFLFLGD